MARLIGNLNEGSLLRRTVITVSTLVVGSVTFVALMSLLLVSIAKAVLPSHAAAEDAAEAKDDEAAAQADGAAPPKPAAGKQRSKRIPRTPSAEAERPAE
ncbi:MAG: hypothetical protein IT372_25940 [Polyangiaceae bacterium]|nr:hypothetical protein [Polyangiaceae bacterium]